MRTDFCVHYKGTGFPPTNRYCRECPIAHNACDELWSCVVELSNLNKGMSVKLPGTRVEMYPNPNNWQIVHLRVNSQWNLGKEDFLYFIATGHAQLGRKDQRQDLIVSPSMTRQEPYVQSIIQAIGGDDIPEIRAVRSIQLRR
ncbi:MAG: hypothetical protein ABSB80_00160 [Methanoregula sp.]|jgi:hypothetical protein|uniref:hypothetical protein n=1 Tax=Methanoregula sp. TaxID=2052170 RepID=UPI003D122BBF